MDLIAGLEVSAYTVCMTLQFLTGTGHVRKTPIAPPNGVRWELTEKGRPALHGTAGVA